MARTREKHGMSKTPEYIALKQAKSRCVNPKDKNFADYGGRGITVSPEWSNSFEQFMADMGPRPDGAVLKRRDTNAGYSKANCYWGAKDQRFASIREKATGKGPEPRLFATIGDKRQSLVEWCRALGVSYPRARYNVAFRGMSGADAISAASLPPQPKKKKAKELKRPAERREPPLTVAGLRHRCDVQEGSGCWLWRGAVTHGYPRVYTHCHEHKERRVMCGKAAAWNIARGRSPLPGHRVVQTCGSRLCLNPDHLELQRKTAAPSVEGRPLRRAKQLDLLAGA